MTKILKDKKDDNEKGKKKKKKKKLDKNFFAQLFG